MFKTSTIIAVGWVGFCLIFAISSHIQDKEQYLGTNLLEKGLVRVAPLPSSESFSLKEIEKRSQVFQPASLETSEECLLLVYGLENEDVLTLAFEESFLLDSSGNAIQFTGSMVPLKKRMLGEAENEAVAYATSIAIPFHVIPENYGDHPVLLQVKTGKIFRPSYHKFHLRSTSIHDLSEYNQEDQQINSLIIGMIATIGILYLCLTIFFRGRPYMSAFSLFIFSTMVLFLHFEDHTIGLLTNKALMEMSYFHCDQILTWIAWSLFLRFSRKYLNLDQKHPQKEKKDHNALLLNKIGHKSVLAIGIFLLFSLVLHLSLVLIQGQDGTNFYYDHFYPLFHSIFYVLLIGLDMIGLVIGFYAIAMRQHQNGGEEMKSKIYFCATFLLWLGAIIHSLRYLGWEIVASDIQPVDLALGLQPIIFSFGTAFQYYSLHKVNEVNKKRVKIKETIIDQKQKELMKSQKSSQIQNEIFILGEKVRSLQARIELLKIQNEELGKEESHEDELNNFFFSQLKKNDLVETEFEQGKYLPSYLTVLCQCLKDGKNTSIDNLAFEMGLASAKVLEAKILEECNMKPKLIKSKVYLMYAAWRLISSDDMVGDIAQALGYKRGSKGNFSRFFHKHMNENPENFRKHWKENIDRIDSDQEKIISQTINLSKLRRGESLVLKYQKDLGLYIGSTN